MHIVTPFLRALAPMIRTDGFILSVCGFLLVWTLLSAVSLLRTSRRLRGQFHAANRLLQGSEDAIAFAAEFATISGQLGQLGLLQRPWRGYQHSLIIPSAAGRPVVATAQPRTWFDLGALFREAGADPRYHAALPGLLVGAGLFFTFLGLAAALTAASNIVGGDEAGRNAALQDMLGAASVKFITSLVGLLLSITYAVYRKWRLRLVEVAFDQFNTRLLELMPFKTGAALQAEANALLERQYTVMQRIETEFFINLGQVLEGALSPALSLHVGPLAAAIEKLSAGLANQNEGAVEAMLRSFLERLEGAVGNQMNGTADRLAALASGLADAVASFQRQMEAGAAEGTARLTGQIEAMLAQLRDLSQEQRQAGSDSAQALAATVGQAAASLEATAGQVAAALGGGAADASARLVAATEAMREDLRGVLAQFGATLDQSGAAVAQGAARGGEALAGQVASAAAQLQAAGEAAAASLRDGGAEAGRGMADSARTMVAGSDGLAARIARLGDEGIALAQRIAALDGVVREAASPLAASAADLRSAGESARVAAAPLGQAADAVRTALGEAAAVAAALAAAQRQADGLASRMTEAAGRFEGVDQGIARTIVELGQGFERLQGGIRSHVVEVDKGLAGSISALAGIARSLEDSVEALLDRPARAAE